MRLVVTGGGTGGHIFPALAFAREAQRRIPGTEVLYIGSARGLENGLVEKAGFPFVAIEISGFRRRLSWENVKTVWRFLKGVHAAKRTLRVFSPDVVLGTGGYVAGPVVFAASRLGIPTVIHEQNVVPGLTNRFLARVSDLVAVSFPGTEQAFPRARNVVVTGNPRATEVASADGEEGRRALGVPADKRLVLVVGGSRGARPINDAMLGALDRLGRCGDLHVVYVTGEAHYDTVRAAAGGRIPPNVTLVPFLYDMPAVLAGADLFVGRAGATTLAEITALGVPSVLIPSPYVTNNHQEKNARRLEAEGAAVVLREAELTPQRLAETVLALCANPEGLKAMRAAARRLGIPDAAARLWAAVETLLAERRRIR